MTRDEALLVEQTLSAYRRRDLDGSIQPSPAWADLSPQLRREAYDEGLKLRAMERAMSPRGLTSTGEAVLARIRTSGR